jgi:single-strand DNA-binding protein
MNSVSLVGRLTDDPALRKNRAGIDECRMQIAVQRFARGGRREPGVVYVEVSTFGPEAVECVERLARGSRIGLSGRLDSDEPKDPGQPGWSGVVIDQLDFL